MKYKRILLKLSGEALANNTSNAFDPDFISNIVTELTTAAKSGVQIAIVVGGGNIWRARDNEASPIERTKSDKLGMLATIYNATYLQAALEPHIKATVLSAIAVPELAEQYTANAANELLTAGHIVLLAGGTYNPFFTTDSAAALRACELQADCLLKATNVDGVYSEDPRKNLKAELYQKITFTDVLQNNLQVMDQTAFSLCKENNIPIQVFNLFTAGNLTATIAGEPIGTCIHS